MATPKTTAKQAKFIQEYLVDLNATAAALRAGYAPKCAYHTGYENLRKPHIAKAIAEAQAKLAEKVEITQEIVLRGLYKEATGASEGSTSSARVSAWALLAKHLGMLIERKVIGLKRFEDMTDAELRYVLGEIDGEVAAFESSPGPRTNGSC